MTNQMKTIIKSILGVMVLSGMLLLSDCGSKSDPTPAAATEPQRVTGLMKTGTWKVQSVTVDGTDQSALFKNFTLSFTDAGFASVNGAAVWPSSGT